MRDYYEVLGVNMDSSDDDIRRSYKKLALKYHPDRHPGDEQVHYSRLFQEVNNAYVVLSDPQERAWYDDHRVSLLRGGSAGGKSGRGGRGGQQEEEDDGVDGSQLINLWPLFDPRCFDNKYDNANFYRVYRTTFENLWQEEKAYSNMSSTASAMSPPSFGDDETPYAKVATFYSYWSQFRSRKRFGWMDPWERPHQTAPNRQIRRAMEKENEQARQAARKEHSEVVRRLAMFAQKRDPRVKAERERRMEEEDRLEQKRQQEAERKKQIEKRAAEMRREQQQKLLEEQYIDASGSDLESVSSDDLEDLEDEVQRYLSMESNRKGKKNKKKGKNGGRATYAHSEEMEEEEEDTSVYVVGLEDEKEEEEAILEETLEEYEVSLDGNDSAIEGDDSDDLLAAAAALEAKKKKEKKKKHRKQRGGILFTPLPQEVNIEEPYAEKEAEEVVTEENGDETSPQHQEDESNDQEITSETRDEDHLKGSDKEGEEEETKKKARRRRKKDKVGQKQKFDAASDEGEEDTLLRCNVCSEGFSTRNKLFQHVKERGHQLAQGFYEKSNAKKGKKKNKKR